MRMLIRGLLLLALLVLPIAATAAVEGFARISLVQGEAQVRDEETDEWLPAGVNTPLIEGDSVWAPAGSRVEIQFRNGIYLRLEGRTVVDLVDIEQDLQRVHVASGRVYVKTGNRADDLQVDWGDASVLVERRTRLKVDLLANGDEEVAILKGAASVESAGERTRVRGGETITLHDYRGADLSPLRPVDEWERWNTKRDKQLAASKRGEGYLPEELSLYEDELVGNGDWIVVEEYGYVWRPRVSVSIDWAPYRHGRWVWRGGDYVWITSEPWGWVPYHYGRWAMISGRGWCWVPPARGDVYWGPGYVAWINTHDHVGWVPLAPREPYYGRGHYGRHSVDVSRHDRRPVNVTYRNVTINNSITIVKRDGFARGTGRHEVARENIFRQQNVVVPRPDVRPVSRDARMPVVRPVPVKNPPPDTVRRRPVRELRERYPLLREVRRGERPAPVEHREAVPLPGNGKERRLEPRGSVSSPPAAVPLPPPALPRRGQAVAPPRDDRPVSPGEAVPQGAPRHQRSEGTAVHGAPSQPAPVSAPAAQVQAPPPTPAKGTGGEVRSQGPREDVKQRVPRRAWRVETKEQVQKPQVSEGAPQEKAQEPRQEPRQERRRRGE